jgi:hypothetical protein
MPLGFDYTAEKQLTGSENVGGIQWQRAHGLLPAAIFAPSKPLHSSDGITLDQVGRFFDLLMTQRACGIRPAQRLMMHGIRGDCHESPIEYASWLRPCNDASMPSAAIYPRQLVWTK